MSAAGTASPDPAIIRPLGRTSARRMLVCLGFCGGGTGPYRGWGQHLPEDTDLALICYPGREGRFAEGFPRTWEELAQDATDVVRRAADRPYALFGHSMGGWVAFDVATRLERADSPAPDYLIVSSCNAPDRGVTERDRFPRMSDTDDALLDWMLTTGALPDYAVTDPDLRGMAIELMRADVLVRDSFQPSPDAQTRLPTQVLHGAVDAVIAPDIDARWKSVAIGETYLDQLPGGHFYTPEVWGALPIQFRMFAGALAAEARAS
jgi:surfactin synthase thioesterase subunit